MIEGLEDGSIAAESQDGEPLDYPGMGPAERRAYIDSRRLAFLGEQVVNWCSQLGTVLANEEVIDGLSERGDFPVTRTPLRQWVLTLPLMLPRLRAVLTLTVRGVVGSQGQML